ncbi:hypothetical protein JHS3_11200 [Jeongeupia sp. HS-3]|uniref:hypothetical protein n=1 Tax=Jeongeupia sp. HS-3 TaxID=1009682 RepID=UPI0018A58CFC|nr:hypothetical protein [Jeongeupia sp. HS-3]BCL75384.1 hypothetical protein JHS3_11200 [Jeongeupia sp. HS-3]
MVYEELAPADGAHIQLAVRKRRRHTPAPELPADPPSMHRVDVRLQKPFDQDAGDLYDPDYQPEDEITR